MKKLREYKGVVWNEFHWEIEEGRGYNTAAALITSYPRKFTDDDHAALMDLKANPYEPDPLVSTYNLTAADHIAALVAMGAIRQPQSFLFIGRPDENRRDILILPPEMTP
jgi:hypothetical protein